MKIRRVVIGGLTAVAIGVAICGFGVANAATTTDTSSRSTKVDAYLAGHPVVAAQLKVACARIPNAETRTTNLQSRLPGDADTKGSIAWYQAQAQKASDAGYPDLATALTNRANVLLAKNATLANQLSAEQQLKAACSAHGLS